jgi:hypothetical protein
MATNSSLKLRMHEAFIAPSSAPQPHPVLAEDGLGPINDAEVIAGQHASFL